MHTQCFDLQYNCQWNTWTSTSLDCLISHNIFWWELHLMRQGYCRCHVCRQKSYPDLNSASSLVHNATTAQVMSVSFTVWPLRRSIYLCDDMSTWWIHYYISIWCDNPDAIVKKMSREAGPVSKQLETVEDAHRFINKDTVGVIGEPELTMKTLFTCFEDSVL